jgi:NAD(P)-dependent dehydrogenase (short-subunit alcohol dehydrogenase family)
MPDWAFAAIPDLTGKRAIVTGATSGIGLETAAGLAGAGAEVVLTGRDAGKGSRAVAEIHRRHPAARLSFALADQASLHSLAAFAAEMVASGRPLDLLVNNAGVMGLVPRQVTADGFEMQFGTNHLGHFALTAHLVPALLRAPAPRVVTVASMAHRRGWLDFDDLQHERHYHPLRAYSQAKLANLVFALELARRCAAEGSRIASIAAHPGFARTGLFKGSLRVRLAMLAAPFFAQSATAGALPSLYAATAPEARNGGYYGPDGIGETQGNPAPAKISARGRDAATAERLWRESERLTGIRFPPLV